MFFCVTICDTRITSAFSSIGRARSVVPKIVARFAEHAERASDVNQHLPVLRTLAASVDSVLEFGLRGVSSSWAFAMGGVDRARHGLTLNYTACDITRQDQVDALRALGVRAGFLNSTLDEAESRKRLRELYDGAYDLLYLAPERLFAGEGAFLRGVGGDPCEDAGGDRAGGAATGDVEQVR